MTPAEAIEKARWYEREDIATTLRDEANVLADEVERLAALFQQTHGVHHGWVAECARLRGEVLLERTARLSAEVERDGLKLDARVESERLRERVGVLTRALRELQEDGHLVCIIDPSCDSCTRCVARAVLEGTK